MPRVSIVVPAYRSASYLDGCLQSLEGQTHPDLEIIVVDDASPDKTAETVLCHAERDRRVVPLLLERNLGTLGARKAGVLASTGDYVMLVDQDDELEPRAVELLVAYAAAHPADIYHFTARVVAENETARQAAGGMTSFLTPTPRRLVGEEILKTQLAETGGFDWHVHHKMFRGDLARSCYAEATDERLVLSDDIYASFILCSRARSYEALGKKSMAFAATGDMYALLDNPRAAVYQFELAQKANDGDFYIMSEIDAKLREQRQKVLDQKKD